MKFNGVKFRVLRIERLDSLKEDTVYCTPDFDEPIKAVDVMKDLGILMDAEGDFRDQRAKVIKKTNQMAGWALTSFYTRDHRTMKTLWNSLIQPHMDYASQLWYPSLVASHIQDMESPLRAFSRRFSGRDLHVQACSLMRDGQRDIRSFTCGMWPQDWFPTLGINWHPTVTLG